MTNHHVGADDLEKVSTPEKNYLRDGFHAKTHAEEIKCKGLELNVLHRHQGRDGGGGEGRARRDRAGRGVQAPHGQDRRDREGRGRRRRRTSGPTWSRSTPAGSTTSTRSRSTPTSASCSPRRSRSRSSAATRTTSSTRGTTSTCAFFRVYENDKPIKCEHYLKWSRDGSKDGRTGVRLRPPRPHQPAEHGRRTEVPPRHRLPVPAEPAQPAGSAARRRGAAAASRTCSGAEEELFSIQNSRKARIGGLGGLMDPELMGRKVAEEKRLSEFIAAKADGAGERSRGCRAQKAFEPIAKAEKVRAELIKEMTVLENGGRVQLRTRSASPARCCVPRRNCRSRPASGSASSPTPGCRRSSSSSSPTSRSTRTSKRSSSPTACSSSRSRSGRTTTS